MHVAGILVFDGDPPAYDDLVDAIEARLHLVPRYRQRLAFISKTHHALVDGVSGVDVTSVLFDATPDHEPVGGVESDWVARPVPGKSQLLADALLERATVPAEAGRALRALVRRPRRVA